MRYSLDALFGVRGQSVVVTGGSSGIGLEIACALADLGAKTTIIGRTKEKVEKGLAMLKERSGECLAFQADVLDEKAMAKAFAAAAEAFGGIDGLVNSAGINNTGHFTEQPLDSFKQVVDVNLMGVVMACKLVAPYMLGKGSGRIVNISSVRSIQGKSLFSAYCASKAAVDGFTRALAVEWIRKGVNINSVAAGIVVTDFNRGDINSHQESFKRRVDAIPRGKPGETSLVVAPVISLLSPGSAHIVGQTVFVDGGSTIGDTYVMS